jgi:hypothetical protein
MNTATSTQTPAPRNPKFLYCECGHTVRKHYTSRKRGCTLVDCDCTGLRLDAVAREAYRKSGLR